ncbi:MAG: 3-deoxy-D-manno-octulosonic acid transferase [Verrucomicrobiae bacterium]|nr:3-deoxy-D-manno-octulosonic acid transferase [Verrucomicrobiae bacterium]
MIWIYEILFWMGLALAAPFYLLRMRRRGGYARDFMERFGVFSREKAGRLRDLKPVWLHAVSVGEVDLALQLIEQLRSRPDCPPLALSTTTSTGHAMAAKKLPPNVPLFYYPLDSRFCFGRVHRLLQPRAFVLVEAELWPGHLRFCAQRGVPMALINARLSNRCLPRYRRFRWFLEPGFAGFKLVTLQCQADRERLGGLGFPGSALQVAGCLKYDTAHGVDAARRERLLNDFGFFEKRPVWLAGSTHPGEEELAVDIYHRLREKRPSLVLALAPRHAERAGQILTMTRERGLRMARRSKLSEAGGEMDGMVLDTTGELKYLYERADVIFMGKSLLGQGGQNIIEPAVLGKPIVFGPHMENFPVVTADFLEAGAAIQVSDAAGLERETARLLDDPAARQRLGENARAVVQAKRGAMERTIHGLRSLLG